MIRLMPWICASLFLLSFFGTAHGSSLDSARSREIKAGGKAFDHLVEAIRAKDPTTRDVIAEVDRTYRSFFAPLQNPSSIAHLKPSEIVELFDRAFSAQFMTNEARYVVDMQRDLQALERTGHAAQVHYDDLYDALIGSRMFAEASRLRESHRSAAMLPVPEFNDMSSKGRSGPTEIVVSADGRTVTRRDVDVGVPAQILVVASPWCHFAQHSLRDIANDPVLGKAFAQHATWLVPPDDNGTPIADVARWNRAHPSTVMVLAYDYHEWPMIDRWELPTFYFLRNGQLVSEVIGWPSTGRKAELFAAIRRLGLIPAR